MENSLNKSPKSNDFTQLENSICKLNDVFEENTAKAINRNITARNWLIGFYIVNYEQNGEDRAKYGDKTLQRLAENLNKKSLSYRNLKLYRQFYFEFTFLEEPIFDYVLHEFRAEENIFDDFKLTSNWAINDCPITNNNSNLAITDCQIQNSNSNWADTVCPIGQKNYHHLPPDLQLPPERLFKCLSFTHFSLIMTVENPLGRVFYELETIKGTWSVRELKRQIHTNYFERSAISQNPAKMSKYIQSGSEKMDLSDLVKTPFVYEFLGLKDNEIVEESDLEQALINHLQEFILELGNGFCFETRQKRILIDDDYFICDLIFYHRILKCHVLIDLKAKKIKYDDIAQMKLYLSYYRHNIMQKDDNPPIGLLICTQAGKELVKYTTEGIDENLFVKKYKLNLPTEEKLTNWLREEIKRERRL
jgi:predicted nuclease of restriction endonuclease-like (RecB) superfamily